MSQTSAKHPLDNDDPADLPRCPMERLADRFKDVPKPGFMRAGASREPDGSCLVSLLLELTDPDQLEDLINYLARVKG